MIEVLQAYKDGKRIEYRITGTAHWTKTGEPAWQFSNCEYRTAPELKKKVKMEAWLTANGCLVWCDVNKVSTWAIGWTRVPSEDKEIEI